MKNAIQSQPLAAGQAAPANDRAALVAALELAQSKLEMARLYLAQDSRVQAGNIARQLALTQAEIAPVLFNAQA